MIAASVALGGGTHVCAAPASSVDAARHAQQPAQQAAQQPAPAPEREPRHHFAHRDIAHHAKSRAPDVEEKAPPAPARPASAQRGDEGLKPHPVSTVRVQAPPVELLPAPRPEEAPRPEAPTTEAPIADPPAATVSTAAAPASLGQRVDPDTALSALLAAANKIDDAEASAGAATSPLSALEVLALFAVCAGAAVGCYGLLTLLNARRRARRAALAPPRRNPARPMPQRDDRFAERIAQQRLFPHQFGGAIRG